MKKIVFIIFAIFLFTSCDQFIAKNIVIENKSTEKAIVNVKTFTGQGKENSNQDCEVFAGKKITLSLYDNIVVDLKSVGKNYLEKISNTRYEILNAHPVPFTVYNMTSKPIQVSDRNNLFDLTNISSGGNSTINVFNPSKIQVIATTVPEGILLQVQVQDDKLIIK